LNPQDPNLGTLEIVANALGALCDELVLVGGCSVGLLISDPASAPVRETIDVDLVAEVTNINEYYVLGEKLRARGFSQSADQDHLCRWVNGALKIDVMPSNEEVLGHSTNRWYSEAIVTARKITLSNGIALRVISPPLFLATKLEAYYDRGNGDYGASHDLEDIINVVDGRPELNDEVQAATEKIREYLRGEFNELLADASFVDAIPMHLRGDATSQARAPLILERLRRLAGL
jgi:predicted nucleotidyltransferase